MAILLSCISPWLLAMLNMFQGTCNAALLKYFHGILDSSEYPSKQPTTVPLREVAQVAIIAISIDNTSETHTVVLDTRVTLLLLNVIHGIYIIVAGSC